MYASMASKILLCGHNRMVNKAMDFQEEYSFFIGQQAEQMQGRLHSGGT
jgi:NAD(P)H-flavin reductase